VTLLHVICKGYIAVTGEFDVGGVPHPQLITLIVDSDKKVSRLNSYWILIEVLG
jgi:hypothetical protein